jgi:hypothetical protein
VGLSSAISVLPNGATVNVRSGLSVISSTEPSKSLIELHLTVYSLLSASNGSSKSRINYEILKNVSIKVGGNSLKFTVVAATAFNAKCVTRDIGSSFFGAVVANSSFV